MMNDTAPHRALSTSINQQRVTRLASDDQGGPTVSFAYTNAGELLIFLEGKRTLLKSGLAIRQHDESVILRYTVGEWDAFIRGVKDGEFDDYTAEPLPDLIPIRDSKDLTGPMLVFLVRHMRAFFKAVQDGKYDL